MSLATHDIRLARYAGQSHMDAHAHMHASMTVVIEGGYSEIIRGRCTDHGPGAMLFCPGGEPHEQRFGPRGALKLLLRPGDQALDFLADHAPLREAPSTGSAEIARLGLRAAAELTLADAFSPSVIEGIGWELTALFGRQIGRGECGERRSARLVAQARAHLTEHLDAPLSIAGLARDAGVHPTSLLRAFRRELGCTPGELQRRLRSEEAARLLATSAMPLGEIALACGFSDQSHFSRTFRHLHGCTPSQYRARCC